MSANERPNDNATPWLGKVGRACVGLTLFGTMLVLASAAWSQPEADPKKKMTVEEWRKQFPFVSLSDRLNYEAKRGQDQTVLPTLTPESAKRLDQTEKKAGNFFRDGLRTESLKALHSNEAEEFIKRDGFGRGRMPEFRPMTRFLTLPSAPTIPTDNVSYNVSEIADDPQAKLPPTGKGITGPNQMPSLESLTTVHGNGENSFLSQGSFGLVKSRTEVSGFEPHQFRYNPAEFVLNPPAPKGNKEAKERWALKRLELVSLLKFEKPAVYVSVQLPRMQDLKNTPKRALSAFEQKALKQLEAGEDIVTEATTNRIQMMGSLRASKQCLECHQVQRGELLGSFSYEMLRDPPLRVR
jgi:hypothetical protein